jgi:hypothetical protein
MSRAALEQALKDRLGRQGAGAYITFADLVTEARRCNILSVITARAARDLAKSCNDLLHEKPVENDDQALEILAAVRSLLQDIYSSRPGY